MAKSVLPSFDENGEENLEDNHEKHKSRTKSRANEETSCNDKTKSIPADQCHMPLRSSPMAISGSKIEIDKSKCRTAYGSRSSSVNDNINVIESSILEKSSGSQHVMPFVNDDIEFSADLENGVCVRKLLKSSASMSRSPTLSSSLSPTGTDKDTGSNSAPASPGANVSSSEAKEENHDRSKFTNTHKAHQYSNGRPLSPLRCVSIQKTKSDTKENTGDNDDAISDSSSYVHVALSSKETLSTPDVQHQTLDIKAAASTPGSIATESDVHHTYRIIPRQRSLLNRKELAVTGSKVVSKSRFSIDKDLHEETLKTSEKLKSKKTQQRSNNVVNNTAQKVDSVSVASGIVTTERGPGLLIAGNGCSQPSELHSADVYCWSGANPDRDTEVTENLRRISEDSDRDVMRLTKELNEANSILTSLHDNIQSLNAERERSQSALAGVKRDYNALLQEKFACQKQISTLKRYLGKIHDKRMVREIDQLCICYEKLDQREKLMRRQISILEAELTLVVSKLNVPKSSRKILATEKIPPLILDKGPNRPDKLPPVKALPKVSLTNKVCSKVPKEILNITPRSDGTLAKLSGRTESVRRDNVSRRVIPHIDVRAHQASKQVNEIGKECKRLYEKGNEILKKQTSSRRKERIDELRATTEKFGAWNGSRQMTSSGDEGFDIERSILPDICTNRHRQKSIDRPSMIWNDLSVVKKPKRRSDIHQHRKRAILPELGHSKMNLSDRC